MRVISLDPGGGTGWVKHDVFVSTEPDAFLTGCLMSSDHHLELYRLLVSYHPDLIIYEDFTYQIRYIDKGQGIENPNIDLIARDYIGVIKLYVQLRADADDPVRLHRRSPGQGFGAWNDTLLKKLGLFKQGSKQTNGAPHTNDAMRHLLGTLVNEMNRVDYLSRIKPR